MTRLEWDPSLETGNERIDAEHRHLFEIFNVLNEEADQGREQAIRETLEELTAYVATHFAHEEERMRATGFPEEDLAAHVEEHRALTESVRDHVLEYRHRRLAMIELVALLREWLNHHVREIDRVLVDHLQRDNGQA